MKKISYLLLVLSIMLFISCDKKNSGTKPTLDDYKIYKSFIVDSNWYKDLLQKTGKEKIEFRKLDDTELKDVIIMDEQEIKQKPKFFLQPNKSALLQSGLQYRDVLTYGTLLSFCNKITV